ncbi:hypothetical protein B2G74_00170 [Burkholderia sp. A27]|nr:hypothetical protein B2G74_00170 [Burkholderia sp. A27]
MRKNVVSVAVLAAALAGCASDNVKKVAYDPATDARIRVYFGVSTHFYFNIACEPKRGSLGYGGGGGMAVAKPRKLHLGNNVIGMPVPDDAYRYYDEYVVKANQPLTITADVGGRRDDGILVWVTANQHAARMFVPQPGRDYEMYPGNPQGRLELNVRQLNVTDGQIRTQPVRVDSAPLCAG